MTDETAAAIVGTAWELGIRYFDTAPHYGLGLSERRLGDALRGRPRDEYVLSTKVGRLLEENPAYAGERDTDGFDVPATLVRRRDYSRDGVLRSLRMLLADGDPVLSRESVRLMTTDHTTPAHREIGALFLEGDGWGMGGSVAGTRYGWVGGTGTSAHVDLATGTVALLFTQVGMDSPVAPEWLRSFRALTS